MADERNGLPSASGLHRVVECRGSLEEEKDKPESPVGDDWREEGTLLHDCAEIEKTPRSLNEEQRWAVRTALRLKEEFYEKYNLTGKVYKEKRLWAHRPDLTPLFSGKFDEALIGETVCSICDFKFGRKLVPPAAINIQMLAYAVLLWLRWPGRKFYAVAIIQPRVEEEFRFSCAAHEPEQLEEAYEMFVRVLDEAAIPGQPLSPNFHACEYCKAFPCQAAWDFFTSVIF